MATYINPPVTSFTAYEEFTDPAQSPTESQTWLSFSATRWLKCAWPDRLTLAEQLLGTVTGNGVDLFITSPQPYPARSDAFVKNVDIAPFWGGGSASPQQAQWDHAVLTVKYDTAEFTNDLNLGEVETISEDLEPWSEALTLPNQGLFWGDTRPLPEDAPTAKLSRGLTWVYRTKFVQTIPASCLTLVGRVNNVAITSTSLGLVFAEETLLFTPPRIDIKKFGTARFIDVEYRFMYREDGWNKVWRPTTGIYEFIYDRTAARLFTYKLGNFSTIIA
jgi:hypothetical protein